MLADDCYRLEEMNNSSNVKIQMTAEQIFKEIEALPRTEWERLVQRMRESEDIPQDFIDALDDFNQERFVSMETALNETPPRVNYKLPRNGRRRPAGSKELLPEKLQVRETPNERRKLSESIFEGPFKSK